MARAEGGEIAFVVDVTSFTKSGFVGTTSYGGENVGIDFDDKGRGVFLNPGMAKKVGARKGDQVFVIVEDKVHTLARTKVAAIGRKVRISDEKAYYAVGREGGAVVRIRRP
jgi:ABC-type lipoprotein release transport system permease subunit